MNRIWKEFQIGMPFEWILNDGYLRNDDNNFISLEIIFSKF